MIASIEGKLAKKTDSSVIIATVAGLGFEVLVTADTINTIGGTGSEVFLHTYLQVKEDGVALFGFRTQEELEYFKLLITVSGIGPKGALGILSGISVENLQFAILMEDTKTISKVPGIGAKTAGKLILELKDKVRAAATSGINLTDAQVQPKTSSLVEEAVQALTALGYSATEAAKVLRTVQVTESTTVEDLIKQGLKLI